MWNYPRLSKEDRLIVEVAKTQGWKRIPFSIVKVTSTINGEWLISQDYNLPFSIKNSDVKSYIRDKKISKLGL